MSHFLNVQWQQVKEKNFTEFDIYPEQLLLIQYLTEECSVLIISSNKISNLLQKRQP